ncbi:UDP-N-acetylglucosamine--N-acetylmuramyl-(pentapeptide) pyrophosphoryl-undecaprenol N-acetylglucosamine transferase [Pseudoclavibacter triregionum]|nr:UDP-N-acetylglucosamine--N-acetylmuramyl-(pentapeptide) pyrophosphoryl-undecaprenol N-acetylglucosamine transferase [Pseudoclavibacter triregionum]
MTILLAGGGTAGHVNPLLAVADALREREPGIEILVLGTQEGLEASLVPARGYELAVIPKLPFPRRPNLAAARFPTRFASTVRRIRRLATERGVEVVAGFGGYAAAPAYVAARRRLPLVIHEANAMPGLANRLGARWAEHVAVSFPGTPLPHAEVTGMPLRREIERLDRAAARPEAIEAFGLDPARRTLLVTGGSLGAKRINEGIRELGPELIAAGWQLLHVVGRLSPFDDPQLEHYRVVEYCDRMDLAFAAADFVVSRAGASTVCELMAVGLPTLFIPYAVGNGEQRVNIRSLLAGDAALTVADGEFDAEWGRRELLPLLADEARLAALGERARAAGVRDAAAKVAELVLASRGAR